MSYQAVIMLIFLGFAIIEGIKGSLFSKASEVSDDWRVELISTVILFLNP